MPLQKITKEEILNRSLTVFLQQGYHKTTMDDLAKACGLFKGSFYYYFPSKEALMKGILESSLDFVEKHVFSIAYDMTLTPYQRLKKLFQTQENMLLNYGGGCLFGNTALETALIIPEFKDPLSIFFQKWENALTFIYKTKMAEAEAKRLAEETMIMVEGALIFVKLKGENRYLTDYYSKILSIFKNT